MDKTGIVSLLQSPHIWRVGDQQRIERSGFSTGNEAIDAALPEGGWPRQGLTELLCNQTGIGEVSLLLPALAPVSREHTIVWVNPPHLPYAPALINADLNLANIIVIQTASHAEGLWAAEQVLRSGAAGAVLLWLKQNTDYAALRRLHLAAESGRTAAFLYRSTAFANQPSPAPLRLVLQQEQGQFSLTLIKTRGLLSAKAIRADTPGQSRHLRLHPVATAAR